MPEIAALHEIQSVELSITHSSERKGTLSKDVSRKDSLVVGWSLFKGHRDYANN